MFYRLQKAEKKAFLSSHPLCNDAPLFELSVGNNNHHFEWRKGGCGLFCSPKLPLFEDSVSTILSQSLDIGKFPSNGSF